MTPQIELRSDLNAEDDNGQNWALLDNATDPSRVHVGTLLIAGTRASGRSFESPQSMPTDRSTSSSSMRAIRPLASFSPLSAEPPTGT